jgi:hypothetical protein
MTREDLFNAWVPEGTLWSPWGKPVLFAEMNLGWNNQTPAGDFDLPSLEWLSGTRRCAIIVDLPGAEAVALGLSLARQGFRPVPLFNASTAPREVIDLKPVTTALLRGAGELRQMALRPDAPPAFLLDSRRQDGKHKTRPGSYNNRWLVFPQDFPSANFLLAHETREIILIQRERAQPKGDIAHVLRRWQDAGIGIQLVATGSGQARATPFKVNKPSWFRSTWYRNLALFGFKRNAAGGFGARLPEDTGTSHGFG